ncbi:hypothetical protein [Pseudomonas sp. Pc102]|uniref:hypothetical protein n=1 Tax=Pseudomonas sp. Pc102 TaxID=2678261 RepID=UPI001FD15B23|nr:hypothetical protein [Pseudomonas sp. Pc102]
MSPEAFIVLLILGWLLVAVAMLWAMLRITQHHHHPTTRAPRQPVERPVNEHKARQATAPHH